MNSLMNAAEPLLRRIGGFAPFAATLDRSGGVTLYPEYAETRDLPTREIVERLNKMLYKHANKGEARALALAADVQFGKADSGEWRNAVRLHIEHVSGYCVDIFVPYRVKKGWRGKEWRTRFSHPVGQESALNIFTGTPS
jgi:hypothetical protein